MCSCRCKLDVHSVKRKPSGASPKPTLGKLHGRLPTGERGRTDNAGLMPTPDFRPLRMLLGNGYTTSPSTIRNCWPRQLGAAARRQCPCTVCLVGSLEPDSGPMLIVELGALFIQSSRSSSATYEARRRSRAYSRGGQPPESYDACPMRPRRLHNAGYRLSACAKSLWTCLEERGICGFARNGSSEESPDGRQQSHCKKIFPFHVESAGEAGLANQGRRIASSADPEISK
ncbi:hypothetical protein VTN77DRAFT_3792 [Rasamsonia byssochlamydoides]|uniref:uncharacterized protein n=1 Tax=Rasamsonia byssochlamydoides TaxID=89139 RepID=UPI003741FED7